MAKKVSPAKGITETGLARWVNALGVAPSRRGVFAANMLQRLIQGARAIQGGAGHDDPQSMLTDTLANLMHWADYMEVNPSEVFDDASVDFDEALRMARDHWSAERRGEE